MDRRVRLQTARELVGGFLCLPQPDRERACAAEGEEALEGAGGGAGDLAAADETCVVLRTSAHRDAQEQVGVAANELRGAVDDEVRAEL
jgi:hypothetical protein